MVKNLSKKEATKKRKMMLMAPNSLKDQGTSMSLKPSKILAGTVQLTTRSYIPALSNHRPSKKQKIMKFKKARGVSSSLLHSEDSGRAMEELNLPELSSDVTAPVLLLTDSRPISYHDAGDLRPERVSPEDEAAVLGGLRMLSDPDALPRLHHMHPDAPMPHWLTTPALDKATDDLDINLLSSLMWPTAVGAEGGTMDIFADDYEPLAFHGDGHHVHDLMRGPIPSNYLDNLMGDFADSQC